MFPSLPCYARINRASGLAIGTGSCRCQRRVHDQACSRIELIWLSRKVGGVEGIEERGGGNLSRLLCSGAGSSSNGGRSRVYRHAVRHGRQARLLPGLPLDFNRGESILSAKFMWPGVIITRIARVESVLWYLCAEHRGIIPKAS